MVGVVEIGLFLKGILNWVLGKVFDGRFGFVIVLKLDEGFVIEFL